MHVNDQEWVGHQQLCPKGGWEATKCTSVVLSQDGWLWP